MEETKRKENLFVVLVATKSFFSEPAQLDCSMLKSTYGTVLYISSTLALLSTANFQLVHRLEEQRQTLVVDYCID